MTTLLGLAQCVDAENGVILSAAKDLCVTCDSPPFETAAECTIVGTAFDLHPDQHGEAEADALAAQHRAIARVSDGAAGEALDWRGTRYTDFFVMIRREGGWLIDSKVFHAHSRA